jgi:uncharacterized protein YkwD
MRRNRSPETFALELPMSRRALILALALVGCSMAVGQPPSDNDKLRDSLFNKINDLRAEGKAAALKRDPLLDKVAQKHAENMAKQDKYGDDDKNGHFLDGKDPIDRLKAEGHSGKGVGENTGNVFDTKGNKLPGNLAVTTVVQLWKGSPGHYKELMDDGNVWTGVGVAQGKSGKWYFCQLFEVAKK